MYFCASYSSPISKIEILLSYIRPNNYDGRKLFFQKKKKNHKFMHSSLNLNWRQILKYVDCSFFRGSLTQSK